MGTPENSGKSSNVSSCKTVNGGKMRRKDDFILLTTYMWSWIIACEAKVVMTQMYKHEPHSLLFDEIVFFRVHICRRQLIARDMLNPYKAVDRLASAIVVLNPGPHS